MDRYEWEGWIEKKSEDTSGTFWLKFLRIHGQKPANLVSI